MIERDLSVWVPPALGAFRRRRRKSLPFPLEDPSCYTVALGRHALWHGIRSIGLHPGDEVLVPAFNHGSEVEMYNRAGLGCRFFEATPSLAPDPAELERLLSPEVKALHLIHYLGFPQDAARWRKWCDGHGLALIEDGAQSWLARRDERPVGSWGDIAIFCLYKTYGLPDGALLVSDRTMARSRQRPRIGVKPIVKRELSLRKIATRPAARSETLRAFELGDPDRAPARVTTAMVMRLADEQTAAHRRENYSYLLERLHPHVPTPFDQLPAGASPFAFPVTTEDKQGLVGMLRVERIRAESFWSYPHPLVPTERFPGAAGRRAHTVALPVHQELSKDDLEKIAQIANAFFA